MVKINIPKYDDNDNTVQFLKFRSTVKKVFIVTNIINSLLVGCEIFFAFLLGLSGLPLIGAIIFEFIFLMSVVRNGQEKGMRQYSMFQVGCLILFCIRIVLSLPIIETIIFAIYGFRTVMTFFSFKYYIRYLKKMELLREEKKKMETELEEQHKLKQRTISQLFFKSFKSNTKPTQQVTNLSLPPNMKNKDTKEEPNNKSFFKNEYDNFEDIEI
uniref:Transporter n=1 Tax=Parastrongyloides trichosuri TaxID=131310 RepID=A0A0N4Z2F4_PARTI